ncbi:MAG: hypothetical protein ACREHG_05320, partial [Candidatus Saccharimonadales bacterium]
YISGPQSNTEVKAGTFVSTIRAVMRGPGIFAYVRKGGVYQIDFAVYMQIVNAQYIQSKIAGYTLEASTKADGPWKSLMPLKVEEGELCVVDRDHLTGIFTEPTANIHNILDVQSFSPHETKLGWAFFRRHDLAGVNIQFFRLTLRDTAGLLVVKTLPMPDGNPLSEAIMSPGGFKLSHTIIDLKNHQFDHVYPPYPD